MNVALILASGLGLRMGQSTALPKQFFSLAEKPVLVHTLEVFESHPAIHAVCIVYLPTWEHYLADCLQQFGFQKVKWMVPGGDVRQASVFHGLEEIEQHCPGDTIVLVHDGVRPFITEDIITQNIEMVKQAGTAMTATICTDTLVHTENGMTANSCMVRDNTYSVQTPQSYRLKYGLELYRRAHQAKKFNTINCCELFIELGEPVHLVMGTKNNMKLTTEQDIDFLKAMHVIYRNKEMK